MKKSLNTSVLITADNPKGQRAIETFRAQYNKAGLTTEGAQFLNENPGFAAYLLTGIKRFSVKSLGYEQARVILGKNFISPEDVMNSRNRVIYKEEQLVKFVETIPAQEILEWCRDNNYMLVAGPNRPISLLDIRDLKKKYFNERVGGWYTYQNFSKRDKVETKWYMIRKDIVPSSTSKIWEEQQALLSEFEIVPNAAELAWVITTYKAVRDVYLLKGIYVRTSSKDWNSEHICIGDLDSKGMSICSPENLHPNNIGLVSARK